MQWWRREHPRPVLGLSNQSDMGVPTVEHRGRGDTGWFIQLWGHDAILLLGIQALLVAL